MTNVPRLILFTPRSPPALPSCSRVGAFHQLLRRILGVRPALDVNISWHEYCWFRYEYIKISCNAGSWSGGGLGISRSLVSVKPFTSFPGLFLCLVCRKLIVVTFREQTSYFAVDRAEGGKTCRSNTEVDFHSPPHPVQSKPRSEAFEALHLPIRYRVPRGVSRLVSPIQDVTDDAAGSRYDTEAHQQTQTYPFSQGNLDSSKYEYWISR